MKTTPFKILHANVVELSARDFFKKISASEVLANAKLVAWGLATLAPSAPKCFDAIDSVMSVSPGVKSKSKVALALRAEALMCVEKMAEAGWICTGQESEAERSKQFETGFGWACQARSLPLLDALLSHGLSPVSCSSGFWRHTPIGAATYRRWPEGALRLSLAMDEKDAERGQQLHGCYFEDLMDDWDKGAPLALELGKAWIKAGWSIDPVAGKNGLLHKACVSSGKAAFIEVLLELGANPNHRGQGGRTPLHACAESSGDENGEKVATQKLLNAGADPMAKDAHGYRPIDLAKISGSAALLVLDAPTKAGLEVEVIEASIDACDTQLEEAMRALLVDGLPVALHDGRTLSSADEIVEAAKSRSQSKSASRL